MGAGGEVIPRCGVVGWLHKKCLVVRDRKIFPYRDCTPFGAEWESKLTASVYLSAIFSLWSNLGQKLFDWCNALHA